MKKDDVTILVNSCDLYEDTWYPFFKLLQMQWPDCPYKVMLNTETKEYNCPFMNVETIKSGNEKSWTARLKYALNKIDSEFVLFFLEDFFFLNPLEPKFLKKPSISSRKMTMWGWFILPLPRKKCPNLRMTWKTAFTNCP